MAFPVFVPDELVVPPPDDYLENSLVKHTVMKGGQFTSFSYKPIQNSFMLQFLCKQKGNNVLDLLMMVTFLETDTDRENGTSTDVMKRGICLEGACYRFLGHNDNQLADKTCFMMHDSELAIYDYLAKFADFSSVAEVSKRSECIGNLFVGFEHELALSDNDYFVVNDIKRGRHNYSRGCGYMTMEFADQVKQLLKLDFTPCIVKVVYQGFYGTFLLRNDLNFVKVEFRDSMKKFSFQHRDLFTSMTSLGVLDLSRPYSNGYLGPKEIMLLVDGGVSRDYLIRLQEEYYSLLDNLCTSKTQAAFYLQTTGREELLKRLNSEGLGTIKEELEQIRDEEVEKMRCRDDPTSTQSYKARSVLKVLVPKSRVVMAGCDPYNKLEYGQCFFNPTLSAEEEKDFTEVDKVVIFRDCCYYPGDVIVLKVVRKCEDLNYLKDCIVFPSKGTTPHAMECGGGDLARDKFFVSWDPNLIPRWKSSPFSYWPCSTAHLGGRIYEQRLQLRFREKAKDYLNSVFGNPDDYARQVKMKQRQELALYFTAFDTNLPNKFDEIFMKYASALGPSCKQCRHLHQAYFRSASNAGKGEELERVMTQYENEYKDLLRPETKPDRCCLINKLIKHGWMKPFFDPGDDVWNAMELTAQAYLRRLQQIREENSKTDDQEPGKEHS